MNVKLGVGSVVDEKEVTVAKVFVRIAQCEWVIVPMFLARDALNERVIVPWTLVIPPTVWVPVVQCEWVIIPWVLVIPA